MPRARTIVGAAALALAAVQYLWAEAISAAAFTPRYDYAQNYISDLGVPDCGIVYDGRDVCSPLHALMNTAFIADGLLFFIGAILLVRLIPGVLGFAVAAAAFLHAAGNVLVGLFDETTPAVGGAPSIHVIGATLAIAFGNVAVILASARVIRTRVAAGIAGIVVGSIGIIALGVLGAGVAGLPEGLIERTAVYPITASELVFGVAILLVIVRGSKTGSTP